MRCADVHGAGVPDSHIGVHRADVPHPPLPCREGKINSTLLFPRLCHLVNIALCHCHSLEDNIDVISLIVYIRHLLLISM